ncbi:MAG TPA: hypothetical protein VD970_18080 [Acetobacteraceae bacterium]|nr:hypothetical protein [Acetobacteraceae bacterium]
MMMKTAGAGMMMGLASVALTGAFLTGAALGAAGVALAMMGRDRMRGGQSGRWPEETTGATTMSGGTAAAPSAEEDAAGL